MGEEKKKLEKNDMNRIISNIIEVTMLAMYHIDGLDEQELIDVAYSAGNLNYIIIAKQSYRYNGIISETSNNENFAFMGMINYKGEKVGDIHIESFYSKKSIYGVIISFKGNLYRFDYKIVNGKIELIDSKEKINYKDDNDGVEINEEAPTFNKQKKD